MTVLTLPVERERSGAVIAVRLATGQASITVVSGGTGEIRSGTAIESAGREGATEGDGRLSHLLLLGVTGSGLIFSTGRWRVVALTVAVVRVVRDGREIAAVADSKNASTRGPTRANSRTV